MTPTAKQPPIASAVPVSRERPDLNNMPTIIPPATPKLNVCNSTVGEYLVNSVPEKICSTDSN